MEHNIGVVGVVLLLRRGFIAFATVNQVSDESEVQQEEQEWWQARGMPWKDKPGKADIWCLSLFGIVFVISLLLLPIRAWALADQARYPWGVALLGSNTLVTALGVVNGVGAALPFVWPILLGGIARIKFHALYWWAGSLWGRGYLDMYAEQSKRAARNVAKVERIAKKIGPWGFALAYLPIPLPIGLVVFILAGAEGMKLRTFLILDFIAATLWMVPFYYLGHSLGEPAQEVLEVYAKFANYVVIALMVFVFVGIFRKQSKQKSA